jgi:hypothetical protein
VKGSWTACGGFAGFDEAPVTVRVYAPAGVPVEEIGGPVDELEEPPPQDQSPITTHAKMSKARAWRPLVDEPNKQAATIRTETIRQIPKRHPKTARGFWKRAGIDELACAAV